MAAADVVNTAEVRGVNFDARDVVIKRDVVDVGTTVRTTLDYGTFTEPEISVFEDVFLVSFARLVFVNFDVDLEFRLLVLARFGQLEVKVISWYSEWFMRLNA